MDKKGIPLQCISTGKTFHFWEKTQSTKQTNN
jgi:hypothetical protein